jgi:hypothetical protein
MVYFGGRIIRGMITDHLHGTAIRERAATLELEITEALARFNRETDCYISRVDIANMLTDASDLPVRQVASVEVKVKY